MFAFRLTDYPTSTPPSSHDYSPGFASIFGGARLRIFCKLCQLWMWSTFWQLNYIAGRHDTSTTALQMDRAAKIPPQTGYSYAYDYPKTAWQMWAVETIRDEETCNRLGSLVTWTYHFFIGGEVTFPQIKVVLANHTFWFVSTKPKPYRWERIRTRLYRERANFSNDGTITSTTSIIDS